VSRMCYFFVDSGFKYGQRARNDVRQDDSNSKEWFLRDLDSIFGFVRVGFGIWKLIF